MKLAITYDNGQVFQHFGKTEAFKIYDIVEGKVGASMVMSTNGQGHGALAGLLVLSRMIQERWISRLPVTRRIEKKWQSWRADVKQSRITLSSNDITATHIWHFSSRPDVHTRFVYIWHLLVIRLSVIRCTD